eukprot:10067052-Heterocapsa_arctica.AAC.1
MAKVLTAEFRQSPRHFQEHMAKVLTAEGYLRLKVVLPPGDRRDDLDPCGRFAHHGAGRDRRGEVAREAPE